MKYFGKTSGSNDVADKAYVDSQAGGNSYDGYNSVTTVVNLPITKKNIIATLSIAQGYPLSLSSNLSVGGELFLYVKTLNTGGSMINIPTSLGGYPVSYCGTYNSSADSSTIQLACSKDGKNVITGLTTVTLHIFFDGMIYYVDRISGVTSNSLSISENN